MTESDKVAESARMTARDYVIEWCAQLGIPPTGEPADAAAARVDALMMRRNGSVSREEAYGVAQTAMLNWVEDTISLRPPDVYQEAGW